MLTLEEEQHFDNFIEMTNTKGWKQLLSNLQDNLDIVSQVEYCKTLEDLYRAKGNREVLLSIINFKESVISSREALISEREDTLNEEA